MMLQLNLSPQLQERLHQEAVRRGEPAEAVVLRLLNEHLPPTQEALDARRAAAIAMLKQWMEEDANMTEEEAAANAEVLRALDEDRPSYRKLFTELLKDDTQ